MCKVIERNGFNWLRIKTHIGLTESIDGIWGLVIYRKFLDLKGNGQLLRNNFPPRT
jgi:hypothetical protein